MIDTDVDARECSNVRVIDAGFEALQNQDDINLIVVFFVD